MRMKEFIYTVKDPLGIHARPAGMLVKAASGFKSDITIELDGKSADAKRIFAVMGLGAKCGHSLKINISGADEEEATHALGEFLENNL